MIRITSFIVLVVIVALMRLLPHPPNFSPVLAIALFAGAKAPNRWLKYILPVAALWLSDLVLGLHSLMLVVALMLMVTAFIGVRSERELGSQPVFSKGLGWTFSSVAASILFFLVTNFAVWQQSDMYPHTSEGLWTCYVMALPFFQNQLAATWAFSLLLFGAWSAIDYLQKDALASFAQR